MQDAGDPRLAYLMAMWVHPDARGSGASDALVDALLGWARTAGATTARLDVISTNRHAHRLYERHGFRLTGRAKRRERDGAEQLEMERPIGREPDAPKARSGAADRGRGPMSPGTRQGRRSLDAVFGLFLATGVTVGTYCLWAIADWMFPQGERGFGLSIIGAFSFVPALLAWLAGGVLMLRGSRGSGLRRGVALTTVHSAWWVLLTGIELWRDNPSSGWPWRALNIVEPGLYAAGITFLAARWFWWHRREHLLPVAA
jgi:hypothetical protein